MTQQLTKIAISIAVNYECPLTGNPLTTIYYHADPETADIEALLEYLGFNDPNISIGTFPENLKREIEKTFGKIKSESTAVDSPSGEYSPDFEGSAPQQ
jgi:hypothetical protein